MHKIVRENTNLCMYTQYPGRKRAETIYFHLIMVSTSLIQCFAGRLSDLERQRIGVGDVFGENKKFSPTGSSSYIHICDLKYLVETIKLTKGGILEKKIGKRNFDLGEGNFF